MHANKYTLVFFKQKFYSKFPESKIEILNFLEGNRILVKNEFGLCNVINSMLLRYGTTSIRAAINKTDYFINQAIKKHRNRFNYSKVIYSKHNKNVIITCPIHGDFMQSPEKHLTYKGCSKCSYNESHNNLTKDTTYFIQKAKEIHKNTYDYSLSNYVKAKEKIIIICKEHGLFEQTPNNHLQGQGCPVCGQIKTESSRRKDLNVFIEQANKKHNNKFDYSLVNYKNTDTKITIICPIHGKYQQTPSSHLNSQDCIKCSNKKISNYQKTLNNGWNYSIWEKKGNESKTFNGFKCYIIKCYNNTEEFYKIGKTFNDLTKRFSCKNVLPYNYEIVKLIKGSAKEISKLERDLHKKHKQYSYTPHIYFEGNSECFYELELETIKNL